MRKQVVAKGNVRRGDINRAVLTDTLPEEVPIIFSNDGFYRNLIRPISNSDAVDFRDAILADNKNYTIPYRYGVLRDSRSARRLSLIHPSAQLEVARFYNKYDTLICDFCTKSTTSLRAPVRVGSTFFVKGPSSEKNKFKNSGIDTVSLETTVSNPASYFVYNKLRRAHEFFDSNEYVHLEKRFALFRSVDVSKCFNSIYTHTMYWAIDSVRGAKENTSSSGFSNDFDRLMQSMNYNETNGICIGPEVSRVFAEVLFSEIDRRVVGYLAKRRLVHKEDYEIRRYVDDFYIFTHSAALADRVTAAIEVCLSDFNLHLNEGKLTTLFRPFATKKSQIISDTNDCLEQFFEKFICSRTVNGEMMPYPRTIYRSDALARFFYKQVKATCSLHNTNYETVSDYIISACARRVINLSASAEYDQGIATGDSGLYVDAFTLLIEVIYFFYTVNATVRASLHVARAVVTATRLFQSKFPDRAPFLAETIVRWTIELINSVTKGQRHKDLTAVPIEVLNVLIPMKEVVDNEPLVDELLVRLCEDVSEFGYFEIITFLFLFGPGFRHAKIRNALFARAKAIVAESLGPYSDAQAAHLCLDILSCPFLPLEKRASWFNTLRGGVSLPKLLRADAQSAVEAFTSQHWFAHWQKVDLLAILRKKELSAVY